MKDQKIKIPKELRIGQKIYVESSFHLSAGSLDVTGGLATITKVSKGFSGGEEVLFVEVKEHPGHSYNWTQFLSEEQENLKKEFGKQEAYASPDIDTPWIEPGDAVGFC